MFYDLYISNIQKTQQLGTTMILLYRYAITGQNQLLKCSKMLIMLIMTFQSTKDLKEMLTYI